MKIYYLGQHMGGTCNEERLFYHTLVLDKQKKKMFMIVDAFCVADEVSFISILMNVRIAHVGERFKLFDLGCKPIISDEVGDEFFERGKYNPYISEVKEILERVKC